MILMASRALARSARGAHDYLSLYGRLLRDISQPVVLHWLGDMFDPALRGWWGSNDLAARARHRGHADPRQRRSGVEGIKVSLLDAKWELELRRRLPAGVKMYTGDDFNYARADGRRRAEATRTDCSASSIRSHRWPRWPWVSLRPATARACRAARSDGRAVTRDLSCTDAPLQGRGRVPRLAQRTPAAFLDGGGLAVGARRAAFRARVRTGRPILACSPTPELACRRMQAFLSVNAGVES